MTDAPSPTPAAACEQLSAALAPELEWEWDPRFGAALAAFSKDLEPKVLAALDEVFDTIWSQAELASAPDHVSSLAAGLGGLRSGQMLLSAFTGTEGLNLYCAWWPWGSGSRISIRVGAIPKSEAGDRSAGEALVRAAFKL